MNSIKLYEHFFLYHIPVTHLLLFIYLFILPQIHSYCGPKISTFRTLITKRSVTAQPIYPVLVLQTYLVGEKGWSYN